MSHPLGKPFDPDKTVVDLSVDSVSLLDQMKQQGLGYNPRCTEKAVMLNYVQISIRMLENSKMFLPSELKSMKGTLTSEVRKFFKPKHLL